MDDRFRGLENAVSLQGMLGYLNFSEGKADARFQKQLNDAYGFLAEHGSAEPWQPLEELLRARLAALEAGGSSPFRDATQARTVLSLVFTKLVPAYRQHHADLLFHLDEKDFYQPFFLARACEAVLDQGPPWDEETRVLTGALAQLNDYVGYRPIAVLENRPRGEPYAHERVRPIPLYLRGVGPAWGRTHDLIGRTLTILNETDAGIRADASFDPELLDELALDPRAYDHSHPVNRRPNYVFGEWDPHHLDVQGRYRRFVVRSVILDGLLERVEQPGNLDRQEVLFEAAAVLAGTVLMASGISGGGPATHDSFTTLATLMPRIARYRDMFYTQLLKTVVGTHAGRLQHELATTRQPFGAVRQHLNQYLARQRAFQLQQRHLALLCADMGYAGASRDQAARIPTASLRLLSEIQGRLTAGLLLANRGELAQAARLLPEIEDLLQRGIAAGALVDPWNILGFQGLFPLFPTQEDSIRDPRIDELLQVMESLFDLYHRLMSEAAGRGERDLVPALKRDLRRRAAWWDQFASTSVGDLRPVHGGEAASSAEHVAAALALWHERGNAASDLAFWRQQQEGFHSPKAFALVVNALLRKEDYQAAMALLMTWLGQAEQVPLDEGEYSFHDLALRWMLSVTGSLPTAAAPREPGAGPSADHWPLVKKFFAYLEANAEDYWHVPELSLGSEADIVADEADEEESIYGAAYADVTYQDSTDDDQEGSVADGSTLHKDFELELEGERLGKHLRFLSTVARLWQIAAQKHVAGSVGQQGPIHEEFTEWLTAARANQHRLLVLLDAVHDCPVPEPSGSHDSIVEYDRRRVLKEQLLFHAVGTCLDTFLAVGTLEGTAGADRPEGPAADLPPWGPLANRLEQALLRGDAGEARAVLPAFLRFFKEEPLLFMPLADGGHPRQILRVRITQNVLRALAANLPRLGILREAYQLLKIARAMERAHPPQGRGVSQFNELFQADYQAVIEAVVDSTSAWSSAAQGLHPATMHQAVKAVERALIDLLEKLTTPFLKLWIEHSRTLQLSALETVRDDKDWNAQRAFIQRYGNDLFHAKFMTLGNLRGILHRGAGAYLDYLRDNPDPLHPVRLIEELDQEIPRAQAISHLENVLQALVENYEEYKDYNSTCAQSDYGENLHLLLDFLRLKASYERQSWNLRPLVWTHEVLVRKLHHEAALLWQQAFTRYNRPAAEQHLAELSRLEKVHGVRLSTIADRLQERFTRPLDVDRLCAWIKPAMEEVNQPEQPSFQQLERELQTYCATPSGVGLDVPLWLRRLEQEVERVWLTRSSIAVLAENFFRLPRRILSLEDLQRQLHDWEKPLEE